MGSYDDAVWIADVNAAHTLGLADIYIYLLIDTEYLPIVMIYYWLFLLMPLCDFFERVIFHNVMSKIVCILFVPCSRKTHGRSRT